MAALHECDCSCADERLGVYTNGTVDFYQFLGRVLELDGGNWTSEEFELDCGDGAWSASYDGDGTISGASFSGTASGIVSGPFGGPITVTVSGSFASPGNGTFTVSISGAITATTTSPGVISGGVITSPPVLSVTTPAGVTVTSQSPSFTQTSPTTFDFSGTLSGTSTGSTIFVFDKLTVSGTGKRQVEVERFNADTGEKVYGWKNTITPWRRGTCSLQMYVSYWNKSLCAARPPCRDCLKPHTTFSMPLCDPDCSLYALLVELNGISDLPGAPDCTAECAAWNGRTFILYPDASTGAACRWTGGAGMPTGCSGNFAREYNGLFSGGGISINWCDPSSPSCHPWGVGTAAAAFPGGVPADCDHLGSFGTQNLVGSAAGGCQGTPTGPFGLNVIGTVSVIPL